MMLVATMAAGSAQRKAPKGWQKGQSGNPSGRRKHKPISEAFLLALAEPSSRGSRQTMLDKVVRRMMEIVLEAEPKESLKAWELIWKYLEGMPQQTIDIQYERALQDMAERKGIPLSIVTARARMLATRYATEDGIVIDGFAEPVQPIRTGQIQPAIKRVR